VTRSEIKNMAGLGVRVQGGTRCFVSDSEIAHTGVGGVSVTGGGLADLSRGGHRVSGNVIHDFSRIQKTYAPAVYLIGVGNLARGNEIFDAPHSALLFSGCDHIVEDNDVSDVLKESADMGAIYANNGLVNRGAVIRGNRIHGLSTDSAQTRTHDISAVYLDELSSGAAVYGNDFSDFNGIGVYINGGRDNRVSGNRFADLRVGVRLSALGLLSVCDARWENDGYGTKNPAADFTAYPYAKYPHLAGLLADAPRRPKYNEIRENAFENVALALEAAPCADYGSGLTLSEMVSENIIEE
jgi:hypothetical protein